MKKKYMSDIIIFSILFVFAAASVLAGKVLKISNSFTAGVITGVFVGCVYFVVKIVKRKKSLKDMADEREQLIMGTASMLAFYCSVIFAALLSIALRATTIHFSFALYDIPSIMLIFMIVTYFISYMIVSRKY